MGTDTTGEKISDHLRNITPLLSDEDIGAVAKIRLILLYIIHKGGQSGTWN